ncbi:MAG: histidine kinase [Ignavibacteriales bacterium]|nr:histidine kinase [Ignavibacteriales bacterium]
MFANSLTGNVAEATFEKRIYTSFFLILTIIGLSTAVQSHYLLYSGARDAINLLRFSVSKLSFMWYFFPLAILLRKLARWELQSAKVKPLCYFIYFAGLFASLIVHQLLTKTIDSFIFNLPESPYSFRVLAYFELLWIDIFGYIVVLMSTHWIEYHKKMQVNNITYTDLMQKLANTKLQELKKGLQPEFLFKTLQIISDQVSRNKNEQANKILSMLSDFLRITVYESDKDFLTIEDDLKFLEIFTAINSLHTGTNINITRSIDPRLQRALVPGFILQPLAKYLIQSAGAANLNSYLLQLRISGDDNYIEIVLADNVRGTMASVCEEDGNIFAAIREQLKQTYKNNSTFQCSFSGGDGRHVRIIIPVKYVS